MGVIWGLVVIVASLVCWGGQVVSALAPPTAERFGLKEADADVDPTFAADGRGEAIWDVFTLWLMVVAGVLLIRDHSAWPYFGLIGGGTYAYFAGRGIASRLVMRRRRIRIGTAQNVAVGIAALAVWGAMALITIGAAIVALEAR